MGRPPGVVAGIVKMLAKGEEPLTPPPARAKAAAITGATTGSAAGSGAGAGAEAEGEAAAGAGFTAAGSDKTAENGITTKASFRRREKNFMLGMREQDLLRGFQGEGRLLWGENDAIRKLYRNRHYPCHRDALTLRCRQGRILSWLMWVGLKPGRSGNNLDLLFSNASRVTTALPCCELLGICERKIMVKRPAWCRVASIVRSPFPTDPKTIGEHLHKRRAELGLTQRQVAAQMGVWLATLVCWEGNRHQPTSKARARIVAWLGFDPRQPK